MTDLKPRVRLLEPYIRRAFSLDENMAIFNTDQQPVLYSDRINRIIVYRGCFNPPHIGHIGLLRNAFENCGKDFNVIAALIDLVSPAGLYGKQHGSIPLILNVSQRAAIWNATDLGWCWANSSSTMPISVFLDQLWRFALRDGFDIRFVTLMGPDHMAYFNPATQPVSRDIMFGESMHRKADSATTSSKALQGCTPWQDLILTSQAARDWATAVSLHKFYGWKPLTSSQEKAVKQAVAKDSSRDFPRRFSRPKSFATTRETLANEYFQSNQHVRIAHFLHDLSVQVRFVSHPMTNSEKISSTNIRLILDKAESEDVLPLINHLVAAPEKFVEILKGTDWWNRKDIILLKQMIRKYDDVHPGVLSVGSSHSILSSTKTYVSPAESEWEDHQFPLEK